MTLVVSNSGKKGLAAILPLYLSKLILGLYVNDWTPAPDAGNDAFVLASFPGYAAVPLRSWVGPSYAGGPARVAELTGPLVTFRAVAAPPTPQMVRGYVVLDDLGNWIWAERVPGSPLVIARTGDTVTIAPRLDATNVGG